MIYRSELGYVRMKQCLLIILARLLTGCTEGTLDQNLIIPFEPVLNFQLFAVPDAGTTVIRSESEWLEFCNNYWNEAIKAPIPYIDFSKKIVIGIFWGDNCKYSGCTNASPSIEFILKSPDRITVQLGPVADLGLCDMCVAPLYMVTIPRTELPVSFTGDLPK